VQQARDYLAGVVTPVPGGKTEPVDSNIFSLPWCDMFVQSSFALAVAMPAACAPLNLPQPVIAPVIHPGALDLSLRLSVPHLRPRNLA
jgi:hypothetical protein